MQTEMKWVDLARSPNLAGAIIHFTDSKDARWAGALFLPAHVPLPSYPIAYNDIYIIQGQLIEKGGLVHSAETFLSRRTDAGLNAGPQGAVLFVYRDRSVRSDTQVTMPASTLEWHPGAAPGITVAPLYATDHLLTLVAWEPGTQMHLHDHPTGEEIFVLSGELRDQNGRYPVGTWQRLYPGTKHRPYTETKTRILLRNGHLRPSASCNRARRICAARFS